MKRFCVAALVLTAAVSVATQERGGTISGSISDADGHAVPTASIRATDVTTGRTYRATSSASGSYTLGPLPEGTYTLTVPRIGFNFVRFEQRGIVVRTEETQRVDVKLEWPGGIYSPGDDITIAVRSRSPAPSGPAPRMPDGKPDLSGAWLGSDDPDPEELSLQPWARTVTLERVKNQGKDMPAGFCLPGDVVLRSPFIYKFVQTPSLLIVLWDGGVPGFHQVFLDGRSHPRDPDPTWMGHSVGHWDGDTLVVDTIGFNDKSWLRMSPHTDRLHVVKRYRRLDLGHLEIEVMIEDPGSLTKPWTGRLLWELAPGEEVHEYICNENNKFAPTGPRR